VNRNIENIGYVSDMSVLTKCIGYICKKIASFWTQSKRKKASILEFQSNWLNEKETILMKRTPSKSQEMIEAAKRGRPKVDFSESSKRTKRRRIAELSITNESAACDLRSCNFQSNAMCSKANIDEVLSLLMEANLSKHQYFLIRSYVNSKTSFDLFPSYGQLLKAKKLTYPDKITVSESKSEVELQSLVDHTARRIVKLQHDVLELEIGDLTAALDIQNTNRKSAIRI